MELETWVALIAGGLGVGLAIIGALLRILYNTLQARINRWEQYVENRFRTLVHEDRDIRNQIQGLSKMLFEFLKKDKE